MTIENTCEKFLKLLFGDYSSDDYKTWIKRFESGHPEMYMDNKSAHIYHDMIFRHHPDIPNDISDDENEGNLMWIKNPIVSCGTKLITCKDCYHEKEHVYNNKFCKENRVCLNGFNDCHCSEHKIFIPTKEDILINILNSLNQTEEVISLKKDFMTYHQKININEMSCKVINTIKNQQKEG